MVCNSLCELLAAWPGSSNKQTLDAEHSCAATVHAWDGVRMPHLQVFPSSAHNLPHRVQEAGELPQCQDQHLWAKESSLDLTTPSLARQLSVSFHFKQFLCYFPSIFAKKKMHMGTWLQWSFLFSVKLIQFEFLKSSLHSAMKFRLETVCKLMVTRKQKVKISRSQHRVSLIKVQAIEALL